MHNSGAESHHECARVSANTVSVLTARRYLNQHQISFRQSHIMLQRRRLLLSALAVPIALSRAEAQGDAPAQAPSSETIRALLGEYTGPGRESLGYVSGISDAGQHRVISVGASGAADNRPLDGDSVFEIGSITKVFTALLMADMAQRGEVAFDDPVAKYLPPEGRPHPYKDRAITLIDLATHTSGLPRLPPNLEPKDPDTPYADYTAAQLYTFLSSYTPQFHPGATWEYSNLGFAVLGHALALRAGRPFEDLLVERICAPLGLDDTRITLTPGMRERLALGHDPGLYPVPAWQGGIFAASGALRSTESDLLRFTDAWQSERNSRLGAAMASALAVRRRTNWQDDAAAGWFVRDAHADEMVWKDGDTGGYAGFAGWSTHTHRTVVLLSNTRSPLSTPRLGWHLLNPAYAAPVLREAIAIDPMRSAAYAGRYSLSPQRVVTVTPRDDCLMMQLTGQMETEIFPVSDTNFFARDSHAVVAFEFAPDGTVSALMLYSSGQFGHAVRIP